MNRNILIILGIVGMLVVLGGGYFFLNQNSASVAPVTNTLSSSPAPSSTETGDYKFETPKKSAHYETNTPVHGAVLAAPPINVVIDFNFDLAPPSSIEILDQEGHPYQVRGGAEISSNKLTLRESMDHAAPDGLYTVKYNACWPDKSCHDGHFQFAIDRSKAASYTDLTGKKEVTVNLKDIAFTPQSIKVSAGTKITWMNDDSEVHYVNSDSHPAHTYYLAQNSKALKKGETFSLTFETPGIYPYHCSAHTSMTGSIIVE